MQIKIYTLLIFFFLSLPLCKAASDKRLDGFTSTTNYYMAANPGGSGSITSTINTTQFKEGYSSLKIDYSLNAQTANFVEVYRSYSTNTLDLSFLPDQLSIWVYGQTGNTDVFKFMLYEDHDMDGNPFETGDEIFVYTSNTVLNNNGWTQLNMPYSSFTKFGGGTGTLDLNRIGVWRIVIENGTATSHSGSIYVDDLRQHTTYTPLSNTSPVLKGSFIQLWNNAGCNCGQWSQSQWNDQLQAMKDVCMEELIIQYSVYGDNAWYTPSALSYVTYKNQTLDRIFQAANSKGIKIYLGLYFDETWNTMDKTIASNYSTLLQKQREVVDELYGLFGSNAALSGWYIPQELNDLEWQSASNTTLVSNYFRDVAAYAKAKDVTKKVMIAPFFGPYRPADNLEIWYTQFLGVATGIDIISPQDGVGTTSKDVDVDIPHYFNAIKNACVARNKTFGATVESFLQTNGHPINNNPFTSMPTPINNLKTQIQESGKFTTELTTFEWGYMQPDLSTATQALYNDYKTYADCIATGILENRDYGGVESYPVPAIAGQSIIVNVKALNGKSMISIVNYMGIELYTFNSDQSSVIEFVIPNDIKPGTYLLRISNADIIQTKAIVVH